MLACLDVHYEEHRSRGACLFTEGFGSDQIVWQTVMEFPPARSYRPGFFYERELPFLLELLRQIPSEFKPTQILIDGYVWTGPGQAGLGAHLDRETGGVFQIVGVGKTRFVPAPAVEIRRHGTSPLFVSSTQDPIGAAQLVLGMPGSARLPNLIRLTDRASRTPLV